MKNYIKNSNIYTKKPELPKQFELDFNIWKRLKRYL